MKKIVKLHKYSEIPNRNIIALDIIRKSLKYFKGV